MSRQLLVAFDESPQARAALRHALETYPEADLTVLHVNDPQEWIFSDGMGGYYSEEAYERAQESAEELLAEAGTIADAYDVEVSTVTEIGQAANAIVGYAEEHGIVHIVVGSHGRTGLSRFLLGSVAEAVARRSPVSITIIREADAE